MTQDTTEQGADGLQVGAPAPDLDVQYSDGQTGRLSEVWSRQPMLLALTRHLGCAFCRQQLSQLRDHYPQLQERGIEVVAVTMRDAAETAEMKRTLELPFPCVGDPQRAIYQAYEAPRGSMWQVMGPQVWAPALGALAKGGMGIPKGDLRQLQASFLIDTDGAVVLAHYPSNSADQLACSVVLEAAADGAAG